MLAKRLFVIFARPRENEKNGNNSQTMITITIIMNFNQVITLNNEKEKLVAEAEYWPDKVLCGSVSMAAARQRQPVQLSGRIIIIHGQRVPSEIG